MSKRQKDKALKRSVIVSSNTGSKISKNCILDPASSNKDRKECARTSREKGCNTNCLKLI